MTATYVQRRRTRGWRKPAGAVNCARGVHDVGRWGNPFRVGFSSELLPAGVRTVESNAHAVDLYRQWLRGQPEKIVRAIDELSGKRLMCWCKAGNPCHVQDVLIPLVNDGRLP